MATEPLLPGEPSRLGDYWLAGRLGAGGQGVVYEGYGPQGERVAVKALHADYSAEHRRLFFREVQAVRRVAQFCTARVLAVGLESTPPFIVSEYVAGPTLGQAVEANGPFRAGELYRLAIGIATALTAIHRAGVLHRDLKPANVLLGPDGPRVIDFGVARTDDTSRSTTGVKGTPRYMAPEVFRGHKPTLAVDVWAWGATVLFAATGRPPFEGETMPQLMHAVLNTRPDTSVLPDVLRPVVTAALAKDPSLRPTSQQLLMELLMATQDADLLEKGEQAAADVRPPVADAPTLGERAESAYQGLDAAAQAAVPPILLRMVSDGDELLRPAARAEFSDGQAPETAIEAVLSAFTQAGLLTWDGRNFTITTAALLRAWPRLRDWVEAERAGLASHQELASGARLWDSHGRKKGDLFHGTRLDRTLAWAAEGRRHLTVNTAERAFLNAAARRRSTLRQAVLGGLALLLALSLGAGSLIFLQSRTVARQRDAAIGRQLVAQALQLRRTDPVLARRLAVAAASLAGDTSDTHNALLTVSSQWERDIWPAPGIDGSWFPLPARRTGPQVFSKQNTIALVDPDARRPGRTITVPGAKLREVDLTSDGGRMLTRQQDGTLVLWNVASGAPNILPYKLSYEQADEFWLSPTGTKLVVGGKGTIRVLETATGRELRAVKVDYERDGLALSPDDRSMLVPVADGKGKQRLAWWDLTTGKEIDAPRMPRGVPRGPQKFTHTAFSPDGRFAAIRLGEQLTVLNARTYEVRATLALPGQNRQSAPEHLVFSPNGEHLATAMTLWSTEPGFDSRPHLRHRTDVPCSNTRFTGDGAGLSCFDSWRRFQTIDVTAFVRPRRVADTYNRSAISPDGSTLAAGGISSDTLQVWDTATGARREAIKLPYKLGEPESPTIFLSRNGRSLGVLRKDGSVEIWDVRARAKRLTLNPGPPQAGSTPTPSFSPDGKALATLAPGEKNSVPTVLTFWDTASGRSLGQARTTPQAAGHGGSETRIVWSGDGRRVASATELGVVEFPSGKTAVPPGALPSTVTRSVQALSSDGTLATVDQRALVFWKAGDLKQAGPPIWLPEGTGPNVAFSPDGRLAATADGQGKIDIWDVAEKRRVGLPLTGHTYDSGSGTQTGSLAFSADGSRVHSVGQADGRLVTHLIAPGLLKQTLCKAFGQLTEQEWRTHVPDLDHRKTC
ncbi:WD40 repeat domain-containing serine/threonine protein kinase [Spirillospora sp. CA-253888]